MKKFFIIAGFLPRLTVGVIKLTVFTIAFILQWMLNPTNRERRYGLEGNIMPKDLWDICLWIWDGR